MITKITNIEKYSDTLTNFTMIDGLTPDIVKRKYIWLLNAIVENAIIGQDDYGLVWYSGNWIAGEWEDGTWYSGIWYDGEWKNGNFYSYKFDIKQLLLRNKRILEKDNPIHSQFRFGIWRRGNFYNGYFGPVMYDGDDKTTWDNYGNSGKVPIKVITWPVRWESGDFYNGVFRNAAWMQPEIIKYKTSSTSTLSISTGDKTLKVDSNLSYQLDQYIIIKYDDMNFMRGNITSYDIKTGDLSCNITSIIGDGTYSKWTINLDNIASINYNTGSLKSNFHNGIFYNSEWVNGTFLNGTFQGKTWYNGNFTGGDFVGQPQGTDPNEPDYANTITNWWDGIFNQGNPNIKSRFGSYPITGSTYELSGTSVIWNDGIFINGEFHSGLNIISGVTSVSNNHNRTKWISGTWLNGMWYGGTHINGNFNNGYWYEGFWSGGTFNNGYWINGYWLNGTINNGFIIQGIFKNVIVKGGQIGYQPPEVIKRKLENTALSIPPKIFTLSYKNFV